MVNNNELYDIKHKYSIQRGGSPTQTLKSVEVLCGEHLDAGGQID